MLSVVLLAAISSANCIAYAPDAESIWRCDGQVLSLAGIDVPKDDTAYECETPALRAANWCDSEISTRAAQEIRSMVARGSPIVWYTGERDSEGRMLVAISTNGIDVSERLVALGLARREKFGARDAL